MLFFNANFICYYFYPTKKREEPKERKPYNRKTLKTKGKMGKEKKQKTKMFHVKHF